MEYCWGCKYPQEMREWRPGDVTSNPLPRDEQGNLIGKAWYCEKCHGILTAVPRTIEIKGFIK